MAMPAEKRCSKCGELKPIDAFSKDASHADGHRSSCEDCRHARLIEVRETFPPNATCLYGPHPYYLMPALKARGGQYCSVAHRSAHLRVLNAAMTEKPCQQCGKTKPLQEFFRQALGVGGRRSICADCTSDNHKSDRRQRGLKPPMFPNLATDHTNGRFVSVKSFEERFWEKVQICEHGRTCRECCWPWLARRSPQGYGQFGWRESGDTKTRTRLSHTIAYRLTIGEWPKPIGRHTCDNPPCCQPWHIIPGTYAENSRDMTVRGRQAKGERHPRARLTAPLVLAIRQLKGVADSRDVAAQFNIQRHHVYQVWERRSWKHIP